MIGLFCFGAQIYGKKARFKAFEFDESAIYGFYYGQIVKVRFFDCDWSLDMVKDHNLLFGGVSLYLFLYPLYLHVVKVRGGGVIEYMVKE